MPIFDTLLLDMQNDRAVKALLKGPQEQRRRRREAVERDRKRRAQLAKLLRTYDKNNSGKLDGSELAKLMTDLDDSTPPGTPPTEGELNFVMRVADVSGDKRVDIGELAAAISRWRAFTDHRSEFEEIMQEYDVSNTGTLSKDEAKKYLKDLNGGVELTVEEFDCVFKEADVLGNGVLNKMELQEATTSWYLSMQEKKSCCVVL